MSILRWILLIILLAPVGTVVVSAQGFGALAVQVKQVKINGKSVPINRKRFYLFRGGTKGNTALIKNLNDKDMVSRDCFYCNMKASPEYIAWLKDPKRGGCESPYCSEITDEDSKKVPEFQTAFKKGHEKFGRDYLALKWITTNLPPDLRDGFYRQRKSLIDSLLGGIKPLQTSMTDTKGIRAIFIDIPLKTAGTPPKGMETFLLTNLVPIEFEGIGYIWVCDVDIKSTSTAREPLPLALKYPPVKQSGQVCTVIEKKFPVCADGSCAQR